MAPLIAIGLGLAIVLVFVGLAAAADKKAGNVSMCLIAFAKEQREIATV